MVKKGLRQTPFNFLDGTSFNDANLANEGKAKHII